MKNRIIRLIIIVLIGLATYARSQTTIDYIEYSYSKIPCEVKLSTRFESHKGYDTVFKMSSGSYDKADTNHHFRISNDSVMISSSHRYSSPNPVVGYDVLTWHSSISMVLDRTKKIVKRIIISSGSEFNNGTGTSFSRSSNSIGLKDQPLIIIDNYLSISLSGDSLKDEIGFVSDYKQEGNNHTWDIREGGPFLEDLVDENSKFNLKIRFGYINNTRDQSTNKNTSCAIDLLRKELVIYENINNAPNWTQADCFDIIGRKYLLPIMTRSENQSHISIAELKSGVYFLPIQGKSLKFLVP